MAASDEVARQWVLGGRVQGVGFRPFVYRLAQRHGLRGWVKNRGGEVVVTAQGAPDTLRRFGAALLAEAPPLARPELISAAPSVPEPAEDFRIRDSDPARSAHAQVPPDYFACDDCLTELSDPNNRRYRYPFINCTQCGPRYTLIERLPYDRANTSMAGFPLCRSCAAEYTDPADRRFHAEPIACPVCGPRLAYRPAGDRTNFGDDALAATVAALRAGRIVAVKGIGGYHLICDASDAGAIATLRQRKRRPDKPLAVMFPINDDLATLRRAVVLDDVHETILRDPIRPIVLVPKCPDGPLAPNIAPGNAEIGVMLPYSPLHHLLLTDFGGPLVATSGNISGEPVLTDNSDAEARLATIADGFLHHDRTIVRPADDPVYRMVAGKPRPLRLGRGNAPLDIDLPFPLPRPLLALGGQLKNAIALGWGHRAVVSPHLGDMGTPRGLALLKQVATDLQTLYGVTAEAILCDAHPAYATTHLARQIGLPVSSIYHHEAHASALAGESPHDRDRLVFAWDGAGLGRDGTIWGGEALLGRPGHWRRVATIRPFALLGGDRAARDPWRSALSLCWEAGIDWNSNRPEAELLRHAWTRNVNCPRTSSIGRLFDGAAALLGVVEQASFEGQAPGRLEAIAADNAKAIALPLARRPDGIWQSDWSPLLQDLQDTTQSTAARAGLFHETLAEMLLSQARALRAEHGVSDLGLTGGVFQNRRLSERVLALAERDGFTLHLSERLPCNDAGLSFGQLVEASAGL
ncbi:MAG: carbamoyltransferase HypF [Rhodopseudomonas sp.]|nr:carbamoyltransferase HypF [Rhodopseudomonas sp.]